MPVKIGELRDDEKRNCHVTCKVAVFFQFRRFFRHLVLKQIGNKVNTERKYEQVNTVKRAVMKVYAGSCYDYGNKNSPYYRDMVQPAEFINGQEVENTKKDNKCSFRK